MREFGFMTRATCDRCGVVAVFNGEPESLFNDWDHVNDKDLCPDCTQEYRRLMFGFWHAYKEDNTNDSHTDT